MKTLLIPFLLIILLLEACGKREDFPTESTYRFVNRTGTGITLDLYDNEADYAQNASRITHYRIEAGTTYPVVLQVGKTYWMDWYNDTYTISNWRGATGTVVGSQLQLNVAEGGDTRTLQVVQPDTVRSVMLGGETSSEWKGTDMTGVGHRFVFRKDFTGVHEYGFPSGAITTDIIGYKVYYINTNGSSTIQFRLSITRQQLTTFNVTCNLSGFTPHTGRDSLLITDVSGGGYFVRRQ